MSGVFLRNVNDLWPVLWTLKKLCFKPHTQTNIILAALCHIWMGRAWAEYLDSCTKWTLEARSFHPLAVDGRCWSIHWWNHTLYWLSQWGCDKVKEQKGTWFLQHQQGSAQNWRPSHDLWVACCLDWHMAIWYHSSLNKRAYCPY